MVLLRNLDPQGTAARKSRCLKNCIFRTKVCKGHRHPEGSVENEETHTSEGIPDEESLEWKVNTWNFYVTSVVDKQESTLLPYAIGTQLSDEDLHAIQQLLAETTHCSSLPLYW